MPVKIESSLVEFCEGRECALVLGALVMDELARRVRKHGGDEEVDVCRGTLLSREQYLADLRERNYEDARLAPWGTVPPEDIYKWTDAIGKIK